MAELSAKKAKKEKRASQTLRNGDSLPATPVSVKKAKKLVQNGHSTECPPPTPVSVKKEQLLSRDSLPSSTPVSVIKSKKKQLQNGNDSLSESENKENSVLDTVSNSLSNSSPIAQLKNEKMLRKQEKRERKQKIKEARTAAAAVKSGNLPPSAKASIARTARLRMLVGSKYIIVVASRVVQNRIFIFIDPCLD